MNISAALSVVEEHMDEGGMTGYLDFEVLTCFHTEVGTQPIAQEHI